MAIKSGLRIERTRLLTDSVEGKEVFRVSNWGQWSEQKNGVGFECS